MVFIARNFVGESKRQVIEFSPVTGSTIQLQAEVKRLKRENERLRMEREILKKASAFFAQESV